MPYGVQGVDLPYPAQNASVIPNSVFWMAINYYADRCPLISRLAKIPIGATQFIMNNDNFRPRSSALNGAYTSAGTTLTIMDSSQFTVGDVLEIDSERLLVTAINNTTTITVAGAQEGTTQANHANNTAITLITNARTGGDYDQAAMNRTPSSVTQFLQTVQHAWQVSGALQATSNYMGGAIDPRTRARLMAVQHAMDDMEGGIVRGKGQAVSSTVSNPIQKGLKTLLSTNAVTSPTNASAYKPSDLTKDVLQTAYSKGGKPNLLLVGSSFMTGFAIWGFNLQLAQPKFTELGTQVQTFYVPWLPGVEIVPSPIALATGEAIAINTEEVKLRVRRPLFEQPRGIRGDLTEGDIIFDAAVDVENEYHHVFLSGVTGFAVQS